MTSYKITRRSCLSAGVKTAAAGWLFSQFPLQGAAAEIQTDSYALNPLLPWVKNNWNPPVEVPNDTGNCKLNFGVMSWNFKTGQGAVINRIGSCDISRRPLQTQVEYDWSVNRYFYSARGRVVCEPREGEPVRSWTLEESSKISNSTKTMGTQGQGNASDPILAMAVLLGSGAACNFWVNRKQSFDYTADGKTVLGGCRLEHDLEAEVLLPDGWRSFLLTGHGCLPSHLLRDAAGRPLFFTAFGLSYVLEGVDHV